MVIEQHADVVDQHVDLAAGGLQAIQQSRGVLLQREVAALGVDAGEALARGVRPQLRELRLAGIDTERCDFALQQDTARLLDRLQAAGRKIDVLVNNVGVLLDDHSLTAEGRETSFGSNLLSHYHLTEGLIRRGLMAESRALVINMTSGGGYNVALGTGLLDIDPAREVQRHRRLCVPQARADRAEPVLARHLRQEGVDILRDAPGLGGTRMGSSSPCRASARSCR